MRSCRSFVSSAEFRSSLQCSFCKEMLGMHKMQNKLTIFIQLQSKQLCVYIMEFIGVFCLVAIDVDLYRIHHI